MCIIGYKPTNVRNMTTKELENCWDNNGDGAGYAFFNPETSTWLVKKGFMKFDDFITAFNSENFTKTDCYIVHFRFGTSGIKDGGNTHPFPLFAKTKDEMRQTEFETPYIAVHNGTCGEGEGIYSDTIISLFNYANPLLTIMAKHEEYRESLGPILEKLLHIDIWSKWIFTNNETVEIFGDPWVENEGMFWSNRAYKTVKYRRTKNTNNASGYYNYSGYRSRFNKDTKEWEDWDYTTGQWVSKYKHTSTKNSTKDVHDLITQNRERNQNIINSYSDNKPMIDDKGVIIPYGYKQSELHTEAYVDDTGKIVWEDEAQELFINVQCPTCFSDENLEESTYLNSDFICTDCGTVFKKDTGEILLIDPEYNWKQETDTGTD